MRVSVVMARTGAPAPVSSANGWWVTTWAWSGRKALGSGSATAVSGTMSRVVPVSVSSAEPGAVSATLAGQV